MTLLVLIAKLEISTCLIVYLALKYDYCNFHDSTMTTISKIDRTVLVHLLELENLVYNFVAILAPYRSALWSKRKLLQEIKADLGSKNQLNQEKITIKLTCTVPLVKNNHY